MLQSRYILLCNTTRGTLTVPLLARQCAFKELHTDLLGLDFGGAVLHDAINEMEKCMRIHSHKTATPKAKVSLFTCGLLPSVGF